MSYPYIPQSGRVNHNQKVREYKIKKEEKQKKINRLRWFAIGLLVISLIMLII